jgi:uncharacterized membrane protein
METTEIVALVARWLHILAGMMAVGGAIFVRCVLLPAQCVLAEGDCQRLHQELRRRWSKLVALAVLLLLASGLYNFITLVQAYELPRWYHPVFGVKFLLAMGVFLIASLLAGRTALAERLRANARAWLSLNLALAVAVVCLSGVLRTAPRAAKVAAPAAAAAGQDG